MEIIAELDQNHWINQVIQEIELLLHNSTELFQINIKFARIIPLYWWKLLEKRDLILQGGKIYS